MSTADYKESDTRAKLIDPALYAAQRVEQVAEAEAEAERAARRPPRREICLLGYALQIRRKLSSLGPKFAFDAPSPTGS